jgi:hypothetical protein
MVRFDMVWPLPLKFPVKAEPYQPLVGPWVRGCSGVGSAGEVDIGVQAGVTGPVGGIGGELVEIGEGLD